MSPRFPSRLSLPVTNFLTGERCVLKRIDEVEATAAATEQMVAICNEPAVYAWLFRELFAGQPYDEAAARSFFERASEGWRTNQMFVFLLFTSNGKLAAAIDIKSSDLDEAEIGYWASEKHRGCMTNLAQELLALAGRAGFRKLFGRVRKQNAKSAGVLERSGFTLDRKASERDETNQIYRIELL